MFMNDNNYQLGNLNKIHPSFDDFFHSKKVQLILANIKDNLISKYKNNQMRSNANDKSINSYFEDNINATSSFGGFLTQGDNENKIIIYPENNLIFKAFELTSLDAIKAVILGQDPYHNPKQAQGLSFSVDNSIAAPKSLKNIIKELNSDLSTCESKLAPNYQLSSNHCLFPWAKNGVLLLNSCLTVEHKKPRSHRDLGWLFFTTRVIKMLSDKLSAVVFILWGNDARKFSSFIDNRKHKIIESAHPSFFSANKGFFNSRPFSRTNQYLINNNKHIIDWSLK